MEVSVVYLDFVHSVALGLVGVGDVVDVLAGVGFVD